MSIHDPGSILDAKIKKLTDEERANVRANLIANGADESLIAAILGEPT